MFEVLVFVYENYWRGDAVPELHQLERKLSAHGFEADEIHEALVWLERASNATAPNRDESHQLLFELADALEKAGEFARALAVCIELQSDAGSYRDVDARIDRLTKVQAGS